MAHGLMYDPRGESSLDRYSEYFALLTVPFGQQEYDLSDMTQLLKLYIPADLSVLQSQFGSTDDESNMLDLESGQVRDSSEGP